MLVKAGAGGMGYPKYGGTGGAGGNVYAIGKDGKLVTLNVPEFSQVILNILF